MQSLCVFSRKSVAGHKQVKRLFTPEIKRFLKEWLVRRRENPYPNRDEKKRLAVETGLTYIQVKAEKHMFFEWVKQTSHLTYIIASDMQLVC